MENASFNITLEWAMKPELFDEGVSWLAQHLALHALRATADDYMTETNVPGLKEFDLMDTRLYHNIDPADALDKVIAKFSIEHPLGGDGEETLEARDLVREGLEDLTVTETGDEDMKSVLEKLRKIPANTLDD